MVNFHHLKEINKFIGKSLLHQFIISISNFNLNFLTEIEHLVICIFEKEIFCVKSQFLRLFVLSGFLLKKVSFTIVGMNTWFHH